MKIVMCCGVFDCLHVGHVAHLQEARKLGDRLVVALTADRHVGKGPGRPVFSWQERARMLRALRGVSQVIESVDACLAIDQVRPHIYVKGIEYAGHEIPEHKACQRLGIKIMFINTHPVYHSTKILSGELLRERVRAAQEGQ